ncbi:MAG: hypothetical protein H6624_14670 [Bdellovibrionaceae bacterium]|nr:hypothetical protein [Bdellovibrionales bacterium]MCB9085587.1 hypothetical protein [Pseudobdellovibrionaceae bacterium]
MCPDEKDPLVILVRLDSTQGFFSVADVLVIASRLQNKGLSAIVEAAPGALMDTPSAFFIKVPASDMDKARAALPEALAE